MIYGKLHTSGELTDIYSRALLTYTDGSTDVPLVAMPSSALHGLSLGYDAINKVAVAMPLTDIQKMSITNIPASVLWAIVYQKSASYNLLTATQKANLQSYIDTAALQLKNAMGW